MAINQIMLLLFVRFICCPCFGLSINLFCGLIAKHACDCDAWKKYLNDPFWTKNERMDEVITKEEYDQFILRMHGTNNNNSGKKVDL